MHIFPDGVRPASLCLPNLPIDLLVTQVESFESLYSFVKLVGQGKTCEVKLAVCSETGQRFAVKVIKKGTVLLEKVERELQILHSLDHPNVCRLHKTFEDQDCYYLVFPCYQRTLLSLLKSKTALKLEQKQHIARQIVLAVEYVHSMNIVHRDLKLDNVMVDEGLNVCLIDFGLADFLSSTGFMDKFCGTPFYSSREVLLKRPYTVATDMWSVGVIVFALLAGRLPFHAKDISTLTKKVEHVEYHFHPRDEVDETAKHFVSCLLSAEPGLRLTATAALKHPWFLVEGPEGSD
mmetsp:Transcript_53381/g.134048  ORF Transcript_53381/g.134048 Transcript_53381/m.134048 type:complete len:292 (+) Transcript_53381:213-1088(+)|eukprot:CAMPEP_0177657370 /NCGR_PEP_ID=MMETSP0447-20121125/16142_1 /TAXON_ID=0 /ORGANISM="Stygamoeba regulata, Strain BSH-02190019" /LENGTH=291 /DNA_ID=CAMNT_0019161707 /DNA_START=175 /DNA_END=1050 /DNA_ORIENTATION=-